MRGELAKTLYFLNLEKGVNKNGLKCLSKSCDVSSLKPAVARNLFMS